MNADTPKAAALAKLREKFPAENIAKLPKVNCRNCTQGSGTCQEHPNKRKCAECGNWITPGHIHLDYVGHAETTDRLLDADPEWTWEPMALDAQGLPAYDQFGGLWIRLTIAGVTRIGYGAAGPNKRGPDAIKEVIGDAIRNGSMRFGVALDLWAKTDLHADGREDGPAQELERAARWETGRSEDEWSTQWSKPAAESATAPKGQITSLVIEFKKAGIDSDGDRHRHAGQLLGRQLATFNDLTGDEITQLKKALRGGWPHNMPEEAKPERSEVFGVVSKFIADATTSGQLTEAGGDIAAEKERGNLTPAEVTILRAEWSARKRELETVASA